LLWAFGVTQDGYDSRGYCVKTHAIDWCHSGEQHDTDFNEQQTTNIRLAQQIVQTLLVI
jgi:hypothetical protein